MQHVQRENLRQPAAWLARRAPRLARVFAWLPWIVVAAALELLGRISPADAVDGIGVALLATLAASAGLRHRETLLRAWRGAPGERLRAFLARWRLRFGVDLRGAPPLPGRLPRAWVVLVASLSAATAALALLHGWFPTHAREAIRGVSGLAWLLLLGLVWSVLGGVTLFTWSLAHGFLEERLTARGMGKEWARGIAHWAVAVALGAALAGAIFLPLGWALVPPVAAGLLHTLLTLPASWHVRLVWRTSVPGSRPAWGRLGAWNTGVVSCVVLSTAVCVLLAGGDRLSGVGSAQTAVTALLVRGFAWSAAAAVPVLLALDAGTLLLARWHDPARPWRPLVLLEGTRGRAERRAARAVLARADLDVAFADRGPASCAAHVVLDPALDAPGPPPAPTAWPDPRPWPLRVDPSVLAESGFHARVRRRAEVQARRALRRGIERLWKLAGRRTYRNGHGFWFAPHLWFVPALSRDEDEGLVSTVGPPYHTLFPHAARAHFRRVLAELEVDLLFVEDGIDHRRLWRVVAMLFEHHDMFGARPLEDERHFRGLPDVRVILHEHQLDTSLQRGGYPEPDYEDLGRARVLHVFRDRGGDDERVPVPDDRGTRPVPLEPVLV